jgi:hypothetical protein
MKPFIIRGSIQNAKVVFDTSGLNFKQRQFVQGCSAQLNSKPQPQTATDQNSLAVVMYKDKNNFAGMLLADLQITPDQAWAEMQSDFQKATSKFPQVGMRYSRDEIVALGTEYAGRMMDQLRDGRQWPWPNARAVFQRDGNELVVVATI